MSLEEQYKKLETKKKTKEERKAEKLQFLKEKREGLEEKNKYMEKVASEKAKIREIKGQPFYKKVGEGAIVGIRKGAAALKEQAPRAARSLQSIGSELGRKKAPMGSMFGGALGGGLSGSGASYSGMPSYFSSEKDYTKRKSAGLFGIEEERKVTKQPKRRKKGGKKKGKTITVEGVTYKKVGSTKRRRRKRK